MNPNSYNNCFLSQIEQEQLQVSALRHWRFAVSIPTGDEFQHGYRNSGKHFESYITLMLFIPALPSTKKTTLRNMVVHQTATFSKTMMSKLEQQRRIALQHQIVSSLGRTAVRRISLLCCLVLMVVIVLSLERIAAKIAVFPRSRLVCRMRRVARSLVRESWLRRTISTLW